MGHGHSDRATANTDVCDCERPVSELLAGKFDHQLHERLGFRSRDECCGRHLELDAEKLPPPDDVCGWLVGAASLDQRSELR